MRCLAAVVLGLGLVATACAGPGGQTEDTSAGGGGRLAGQVVVFAASSLTESFGQLGREFERAHPGVRVTFSFGGSDSLGPQIVSGAPAGVFAAASPDTMAQVVQAGETAGRPVLFARNRLQIAVPPGNPGGVGGLQDFADPALKLAVCAPEVPCGSAAAEAFESAGVQAHPDTLEQDVKAVLTKVELGEVDAGMVYRTDVLAAGGRVRGVAFPAAQGVISDYLISDLARAPNPEVAQAFVDFVLSDHGRQVLDDAGFDLP